MIAGVKESEVTEMHDISWESIDSNTVSNQYLVTSN